MKQEPKVLLWDIETLQNITATWGIYDQNIPYQNILVERSIICIAYKWLHEKQVHIISIGQNPSQFEAGPHYDAEVVQKFSEVLSQADVSVYHNGDQYDKKFFNSRLIVAGLPPMPNIQAVDTLKVAKRYFRFNSNRLDYIAGYLGVGRKLKTSGDLWLDVMHGDKKALAKMEKYCMQDVRVLEAVYLKLRSWDEQHPNYNAIAKTVDKCPVCGGKHLISNGYRHTKAGKYRRLQCTDCGAWSKEKANLVTVDVR